MRRENFKSGIKYQIKKEQDFACAVTKRKEKLEVHHKIPVSHGGKGIRENGVAVTKEVHQILDALALEKHIYYDQVMEEGIEYGVGRLNAVPRNMSSFKQESSYLVAD